MTKTDWENVTHYIDTVGTTLKIFSFNKPQDFVKVTTKGNANVTYTIGTQSGTLTPGQSVTVSEVITSFTLTAVSGLQTIEVFAKEAGTEKEESTPSLPSDVAGKIEELSASVAQKANDSDVRKKTVKLEPEDLSETTLGLVTGTGTVNLLSVPQDLSVTPAKVADDTKKLITTLSNNQSVNTINDEKLTNLILDSDVLYSKIGVTTTSELTDDVPYAAKDLNKVKRINFTANGGNLWFLAGMRINGITNQPYSSGVWLRRSDLATIGTGNLSLMFNFYNASNAAQVSDTSIKFNVASEITVGNRKTKTVDGITIVSEITAIAGDWVYITATCDKTYSDTTYIIAFIRVMNMTTGFTSKLDYCNWSFITTTSLLNPNLIYKGEKAPRTVSGINALIQEKVDSAVDAITPPPTPVEIMSELTNPFLKTNIKLLGDSITQGVGGTGFAQDGANVFLDWYINTNGYCWANLLKGYIEGKFNNRAFVTSIRNENIQKVGYSSFMADTGAIFKEIYNYPNKSVDEGKLVFKTYNTKFEVVVTKLAAGGILDVYSNGVKVGEVDTYGTSQTYGNVFLFEGLASGEKTIELRTTARKNASASDTKIFIEAVKVYKVATVINYGMAGISFDWILRGTPNYLSQVIKSDDDIIILQLGTNDRETTADYSRTMLNADKVVKQLLASGKRVIIMSSVPSTVENEATKTDIHMEDVDNIIRHVAINNGLKMISNYQHFIDYCDLKGITIESLFPDKLHPNDAGYLIMYKNITKELGLGRKRDGATW
jgi:lysophospholipase L1-like esterase